MERFWQTLKQEKIKTKEFVSLPQLSSEVRYDTCKLLRLQMDSSSYAMSDSGQTLSHCSQNDKIVPPGREAHSILPIRFFIRKIPRPLDFLQEFIIIYYHDIH